MESPFVKSLKITTIGIVIIASMYSFFNSNFFKFAERAYQCEKKRDLAFEKFIQSQEKINDHQESLNIDFAKSFGKIETIENLTNHFSTYISEKIGYISGELDGLEGQVRRISGIRMSEHRSHIIQIEAMLSKELNYTPTSWNRESPLFRAKK